MVDNKCPGCEEKRKTKSNSSGGKNKKKFGNRARRKAFEAQEKRKLNQATSIPKLAKFGGSVLGFDSNNLKTSSFKKLK